MKSALTTLIAAALFAAGAAHATGTDRIRVEMTSPSETITLTSTEATPARYEVSVYKWTPSGLLPTREVLAYPPIFTVQPNSKQAIKLLARVPRGKVEGAYRLHLRAVEGASLSFSLPLFLQSTDPAARPDLAVTADDTAVHIDNRGEVTEQITHYIAADGSKQSAMQYVLPQSSATMQLPTGVKSLIGRNNTEYKVQQ